MTKEHLDRAVNQIEHPEDSQEFLEELVGLLDLYLIYRHLSVKKKVIKIHIIIGGLLTLNKDLFLEIMGYLKSLVAYLPQKKYSYEIVIDNIPKAFKKLEW